MANYANIKATIDANIKQNGNEEITGPVMNSVLNAMVDSLGAGYQYMGKAVPSTNPGTPDAKVFYLTSDPGTYTNFNGLVVADGEVAFLKWDSAWSKEVTGAATAAQLVQEVGEKGGTIRHNFEVSAWADNKYLIANPTSAYYGQLANSSVFSVTNYIDIHEYAGMLLHYSNMEITAATTNAGLVIFDESRQPIASQYLQTGGAEVAIVPATIEIPANGYFVRLTMHNNVKSLFDCYIEQNIYINGLGKNVQDLDARVTEIEENTVNISRNTLSIGNTEQLDGVGFNSAIVGTGDSLNAVRLQLIRGAKYRLHIVNPSWNRASATSVILVLRAWVNGAWATPIVNLRAGNSVSDCYDFTMPECEYLQLGIRADAGVFVYFQIEYISMSGSSDVDVQRNAHIALMNKYAERYGAKLSTFLASNGSSKICAKDMVLICLATLANNKISSFWGEKVLYAPVFGPNARLDTYASTYADPVSHPFVADLSDYYHIFGGKTGSDTIQGRNLVVVVKSKVDDAWLIGCVLYSTNDVLHDNRFSVMKELFDLLEQRRTGASVSASGLSCQAAYAIVAPVNGNAQNYASYNDFVYVAKQETAIINSHSIVKLVTALVATDWLKPYDILKFSSADPYSGQSGTIYADGDELYAIDALKAILLTSSSIAARCVARYVGERVLTANDGKAIYSFRLVNHTAYGVGTQTWLDWLNSPDYLVWSAETGITLECAGSESEISISTGGTLSGVTGGSIISANTIYS